MTSSYKHRFARTFHQVSRDHPDLPLGQRFAMANLQLREARLTVLITELEACRRSSTAQFNTNPALSDPRPATAAADLAAPGPLLALIPSPTTRAPEPTLLPQATLGL